ncbi:MAG: zinc ribbon domain-containing protein [Nitrososphaeria archaeon]
MYYDDEAEALEEQGEWLRAAELWYRAGYELRAKECIKNLDLEEQLSFWVKRGEDTEAELVVSEIEESMDLDDQIRILEKYGFFIEAINAKFKKNREIDEKDLNVLLAEGYYFDAINYMKKSKKIDLSKVEQILVSAFLSNEVNKKDLELLLQDAKQIYQAEDKLTEFYTKILPKLGKIDEAIKYLESIEVPTPEETIALALLYEKEKKYQKVEELYRKPGFEPLLVKYLLERRKEDEAKKVLKNLRKDSCGIEILEQFLDESCKTGKYIDEYILLEDILGNYEKEAQILEKLGRNDEAAKIYEKAGDIDLKKISYEKSLSNQKAWSGNSMNVQDNANLKCPNCGKPIQSSFALCPYCGYCLTIKSKKCPGCGKEVEFDWKICPYCGGKL